LSFTVHLGARLTGSTGSLERLEDIARAAKLVMVSPMSLR